METQTKPMGPLPGTPGDFSKSPWFWRIVALGIAIVVGGGLMASIRPEHAGVLMVLGFLFFALAAVIAGMASLRSRRRSDERLREAP